MLSALLRDKVFCNSLPEICKPKRRLMTTFLSNALLCWDCLFVLSEAILWIIVVRLPMTNSVYRSVCISIHIYTQSLLLGFTVTNALPHELWLLVVSKLFCWQLSSMIVHFYCFKWFRYQLLSMNIASLWKSKGNAGLFFNFACGRREQTKQTKYSIGLFIFSISNAFD